MTFSRSDLITFAWGAAAAVIVAIAQALVQLEGEAVTDWGAWAVSLGSGILTSLGRYLLTRVPEMMVPDEKPKKTANDVLQAKEKSR